MSRVFVIHAPKDRLVFERLTSQARSGNLPVEFDRMEVKHPWVPAWKAECRTKIYRCEGAIVLISKNSNDGSIAWELECVRGFDTPVLGVQVDKMERGAVPQELADCPVIEWDWPAIARFLQSLTTGSSASSGR